MSKIIKPLLCMATAAAALAQICQHCNGWRAQGMTYSAQLNGLTEWLPIILIIAFFVGFIPAYIHECIKAMRPAAPAEKVQANRPAYHQYKLATIAPVLLVTLLLLAKPSNKTNGSTHDATPTPQKVTAAAPAAQPPAKKHVRHQHPQRENWTVTKCDKGYYIAGQTPNGFNSTF